MSLLPSRPDTTQPDDAEPRVVDVDSEDADDVLSALSSKTARQLLVELHERPAPPSELAERVDTSVQNTQYHLDKLRSAGAVDVVDTAYSEKGREMDVFAPADQPLVIYAGDEEQGSTLRTALSRLLGALGVLAVASLAVQALFDDGLPWESTTGPSGDAGAPAGNGNGNGGGTGTPDEPGITSTGGEGTPTPNATPTPEETPVPDAMPTPESAETAAEAAAGLPPGLLFFAGGVFALAVIAVALWVYQ